MGIALLIARATSKDSPVLAELETNGEIKIAGAMYNLQTGAVVFFG